MGTLGARASAMRERRVRVRSAMIWRRWPAASDRLNSTVRLLVLAVAALGTLVSCESVQFYRQAVHGQWEIATGQRRNRSMIDDRRTDPRLRAQLEKVQAIREFADRELSLPAAGQYERYKDLRRSHVAWAIYASPEFSLDAKTWWYPFVGRLKYRGWFSVEEAVRRARRLIADGYDVFVAPVPAYSTLGWLRDPVLNTFVNLPDTELAELIFHELTHQRLFVPGDTDFNEAFATATGREGVRRWLRAQGRHDELRKYQAALDGERQFVNLVRQTRAELETVYGRTPQPPDDELRREKAAAFERMRTRFLRLAARRPGTRAYSAWFSQPLNNARLNSVSTYYDLVPAFDALLHRQKGDIDQWFAEVRRIGRLPPDQRRAELWRAGGTDGARVDGSPHPPLGAR